MKAKREEEEELFMALPSSKITVSPFSHCTPGSAEANAKSLLRGFVAVALKREIKSLLFLLSAVQRSKGRQSGRSSEKHRSDDTHVFSNIILLLNVNHRFMARNCRNQKANKPCFCSEVSLFRLLA